MAWKFLRTILPTELPRELNWDLHTVTWSLHRQNCWCHWQNIFIGDSIGKVNVSPCWRPSHPLPYFSFFFLIPVSKQALPSQTASNHPLKHSSLLNTNHPSLFFIVTASVFCFLCIYHFFVSKSILFNFNIKISILLLFNVFLVYVFC